MKKNILLISVAIGLISLVGLTILAPHLLVSPGKPIEAHAELAKDCLACHTPFLGGSSEKCIACHKVAEIGLITTKGLPIGKEKKNVAFHQKLRAANCVDCHSDHKGVQPFRPISHFSHSLLDQNLQKQCESCHNNPGDSLHQRLKGNCSQCHDQKAWKPATFNHDRSFRFDRHHPAKCETCHISNNYGEYTCYGCHEHSRSNIREEHFEEGIRDYDNCSKCHRSGDEHEAERIWRSGNFYNGENPSVPSGNYGEGRRNHDDDD